MIPYYFSPYFMRPSGSIFQALNSTWFIFFSPPVKGAPIDFKDLTDLFERIISGIIQVNGFISYLSLGG